MKKLLFVLMISGCLALCSASTLFDNIGTGVYTGAGDYDAGFGDWVANCVGVAGYPNTCANGSWGAPGLFQSFMSNSVASTISDVSLILSLDTGYNTAGSVAIGLYSNTNSTNSPASLIASLGTFTDAQIAALPDTGDGAGILDAGGLPATTLSPNQIYWIGVIQSGSSTQSVWNTETGTNAGTGVAGQYYYNGSAVQNGQNNFPTNGGTFSSTNCDPSGPNPCTYSSTEGAYELKVTVSVGPSSTPEPAAVLLVGGALMALGLVRRKKTRAV